jgi:hypothetical protein
MKLAGAIFWLLLAGGLLLLLYGAWLLRRVRRFGLGPGRPLELAGGAVQLRYPHWWTCELEGSARARLITHDHDGELIVTGAVRQRPAEDPVLALSQYLQRQPIRFDEPSPISIREGPVPGALLASTATLLDQDEERRASLTYYLFEGPSTRLLFIYRCSVLYGLVDNFYLDQIVRTLRIDGLSASLLGAGAPGGRPPGTGPRGLSRQR